jgi:hypothetical protein
MCITNVALMAAGATSAAGLTALVVKIIPPIRNGAKKKAAERNAKEKRS